MKSTEQNNNVSDEPTLKQQKDEIMIKSSNACCICQTPFIHIHHIDMDHANNVFDNLAPLCPNHHAQAHMKGNMHLNLTKDRVKKHRNDWYEYVDKRKRNLSESVMMKHGLIKLMIKNFDRSLGRFGPTHGWSKTFASLDESYLTMTKNEIIDRIFSTSNPTELKIYLETMQRMYQGALEDRANKLKFRDICNACGFEFKNDRII